MEERLPCIPAPAAPSRRLDATIQLSSKLRSRPVFGRLARCWLWIVSQIEELGDLPDGAVVAVLHSEVTRAAATGFAAALGRRTSISAITVPIRSGRPKELVDLLIREHGALRPIVIAYFDYDRAFSGVLELAECLEKTNATVTLRTIDSCARLLLMGLGIALGGLIWHDDHYSR